jgi:hypothetical protein
LPEHPRALPPPGRKAAKAKYRETLGRLENHRRRMGYPEYLRQGWYIGSGPVESACKTVVGRRPKPAGMRWGEEGTEVRTPAGMWWATAVMTAAIESSWCDLLRPLKKYLARVIFSERKRVGKKGWGKEAPPGFEPGIADLQSAALAAWRRGRAPGTPVVSAGRPGRLEPLSASPPPVPYAGNGGPTKGAAGSVRTKRMPKAVAA